VEGGVGIRAACERMGVQRWLVVSHVSGTGAGGNLFHSGGVIGLGAAARSLNSAPGKPPSWMRWPCPALNS
jgi:hypothetical protein